MKLRLLAPAVSAALLALCSCSTSRWSQPVTDPATDPVTGPTPGGATVSTVSGG